ncbi:MAG: hypothetical protein NTX03_11460 [Bacteroidetes bacterium]|nr:hypothetical protein [Bacteroidota bacterium]
MTKAEIKKLRAQIVKGTHLAVTRLIEAKKKEGGYLVISRNGKIVKIKAKDL